MSISYKNKQYSLLVHSGFRLLKFTSFYFVLYFSSYKTLSVSCSSEHFILKKKTLQVVVDQEPFHRIGPWAASV